jgi:hypothetical protein
MDPRYYVGDDTRDELTEPDPPPCESCGAAHDEPCIPECGCRYCRAKELARKEAANG